MHRHVRESSITLGNIKIQILSSFSNAKMFAFARGCTVEFRSRIRTRSVFHGEIYQFLSMDSRLVFFYRGKIFDEVHSLKFLIILFHLFKFLIILCVEIYSVNFSMILCIEVRSMEFLIILVSKFTC